MILSQGRAPSQPATDLEQHEEKPVILRPWDLGTVCYSSMTWPRPTNKGSLCVIIFASPVLPMMWHSIPTANK